MTRSGISPKAFSLYFPAARASRVAGCNIYLVENAIKDALLNSTGIFLAATVIQTKNACGMQNVRQAVLLTKSAKRFQDSLSNGECASRTNMHLVVSRLESAVCMSSLLLNASRLTWLCRARILS